jgi:hypothetical protein
MLMISPNLVGCAPAVGPGAHCDYLILFMGFITFLAGAFGALMLLFEEVAKTGRVP